MYIFEMKFWTRLVNVSSHDVIVFMIMMMMTMRIKIIMMIKKVSDGDYPSHF